MIKGEIVRPDSHKLDTSDLSYEAIRFAKRFDMASDYGKEIIRCVLDQEAKKQELRTAMKEYLEGLDQLT